MKTFPLQSQGNTYKPEAMGRINRGRHLYTHRNGLIQDSSQCLHI